MYSIYTHFLSSISQLVETSPEPDQANRRQRSHPISNHQLSIKQILLFQAFQTPNTHPLGLLSPATPWIASPFGTNPPISHTILSSSPTPLTQPSWWGSVVEPRGRSPPRFSTVRVRRNHEGTPKSNSITFYIYIPVHVPVQHYSFISNEHSRGNGRKRREGLEGGEHKVTYRTVRTVVLYSRVSDLW